MNLILRYFKVLYFNIHEGKHFINGDKVTLTWIQNNAKKLALRLKKYGSLLWYVNYFMRESRQFITCSALLWVVLLNSFFQKDQASLMSKKYLYPENPFVLGFLKMVDFLNETKAIFCDVDNLINNSLLTIFNKIYDNQTYGTTPSLVINSLFLKNGESHGYRFWLIPQVIYSYHSYVL